MHSIYEILINEITHVKHLPGIPGEVLNKPIMIDLWYKWKIGNVHQIRRDQNTILCIAFPNGMSYNNGIDAYVNKYGTNFFKKSELHSRIFIEFTKYAYVSTRSDNSMIWEMFLGISLGSVLARLTENLSLSIISASIILIIRNRIFSKLDYQGYIYAYQTLKKTNPDLCEHEINLLRRDRFSITKFLFQLICGRSSPSNETLISILQE